MKLYWTGTDSLMLIDTSKRGLRKRLYWALFRLFVRVVEFFIEGHFCETDHNRAHLIEFGMRKPIWIVQNVDVEHAEKYTRQPHEGFYVLYYRPKRQDQGFLDWLYGYDIFQKVKQYFLNREDIYFWEVDGTEDMRSVYPMVDFYLRPNRHDGFSRMRKECEIQGIPYYHSRTLPDYHEIIEKIDHEYLLYKSKLQAGQVGGSPTGVPTAGSGRNAL